MKVLECSSAGDIRFSAFGAIVKIEGKEDTIENHYQLSKRFGERVPISWREAKGKHYSHIEINGIKYKKEFANQWYTLLWLIYLDSNPHLVEYAKNYDDFRDIFKGKSLVCQADVIKKYITNGRNSVIEDCMELIKQISLDNRK